MPNGCENNRTIVFIVNKDEFILSKNDVIALAKEFDLVVFDRKNQK